MARKWVQDAETAIMQEQADMRKAEKAASATRRPEKTFAEMLYAIGFIQSNLASSDNEEVREDEADDEQD